MYRDTIFMIEICPDMYHDTVSLSVSSRFCPAFCVSAVARALPWCCLVFRTHVFLPMLSLKICYRKCSMKKTNQLEGIPCHEWYSVLLGSTQLSLLVLLRYVSLDLSRGMKVNEFADLTTNEFVSEYPEENLNVVWSGRKHLETHEYINEPLDQVKPDSCFQSSDEGPFFFFGCV